MPFGEMISSVRVDFTALEADLKKVLARFEKLHKEISEKAVTVSVAGSGRGGSATSEAAMQRRILEERTNNLKQQVNLVRYLDGENARAANAEIARIRIAAKERQADQQQIIRFKRDLAALDEKEQRDGMAMAAKRAAAEKENLRLIEAEQKRVQDGALTLYRHQSGLGPVGGAGTMPPGGGGSFIPPEHLRSLDAASSKWLRQQQEIARAGSLTDRFGKRLDEIGKNELQRMVDGAKQFVSTLALVGTGAVVGGLVAMVKSGLEAEQNYERSRITIAEILTLTTELVDKQGKAVDGAKQMAINLNLAADIYQLIRKEAVRTVLTTEQLREVYTTTVGFALRAGATPENAVKLIAQIANLAKSVGASGERELGFETRALLTGQNISRSRLGRILGLTREEIQQARETGTLLQLLNERLKAGQPFLEQYRRSWTGLITTFQSRFQEFQRQAFEQVFERIRERLRGLDKQFDERTITQWAKRFSDALIQAYDAFEKFFGSDTWKTMVEDFKWIVAHSRQMAEAFLVFKGLQAASAGRAFLRGQNQPGSLLAGTVLGRGAEEAGSLGLGALSRRVSGTVTGAVAGAGLEASLGGKMIAVVTALAAELLPVLITATITAAAIAAGQLLRLSDQRRLVEQETAAARTQMSLPAVRALAARVEAIDRHATPATGFAAIAGDRTATEHAAVVRARRNLREIQEQMSRPGHELMADEALTERQRRQELDVAVRAEQMAQQRIVQEQIKGQLAQGQIAGYQRKVRFQQESQDLQKQRERERLFGDRFRKEIADTDVEKFHDAARVRADQIQKNVKLNGDLRKTLLKESHAKEVQDVKDQLAKEAMARQEFLAKQSDDEIAQIKINAVKELKERYDAIDKEAGSDKEKTREKEEARIALRSKTLREIQDKEREFQEQGRSLARQIRDEEAGFQKRRLEGEKEVRRVQREHIKEERDFLRERKDSLREIERAEKERALRVRRVGTQGGGAFDRLGMFRVTNPSAGIEGEQQSLQQEVLRFLQQSNIASIYEKRLNLAPEVPFATSTRPLEATSRMQGLGGLSLSPPTGALGHSALGMARSQQFVQELAEQATQSGGSAEVVRRLREAGIRVSGGLVAQLQGFETRGLGLGQREGQLGREEAQDRLKQEREDVGRQVEDARRRLQELDERHTAAQQSFNLTIKELNSRFGQEVRQRADDLEKLGIESRKFKEAIRDSHIALRSDLIPILQRAAGVSPAAAQGRALHEGQQFGNFIVNGLTIQVPPEARAAYQHLAEELTKQGRRTSPPRR